MLLLEELVLCVPYLADVESSREHHNAIPSLALCMSMSNKYFYCVHSLSTTTYTLLLFSCPQLQMVENPIDEESYIVVLKDQDISIASVQQKVDVLTSSNPNVQVKHVYRSTLKGFAAKMTLEEAEAMADSDEIDFIEQDGERRALPSDIWGIDRVDQRDLPLDDSYSTSSDGSGVTAYIIDTGIRLDHEEFEGRATWGTNTAKDNKDEDCDGHGTHVAGTVGGKKYGVAKKVSLVAVKVLTCNGTGSVSGVIAGYDWIRQNAKGPSTANASLGGFKSNAENKAIAKLHNSGVVTVVAAGNDNGDACDASPASAAAVLTVAASDHRDRRASFSNWGSCIDIFAPGKSITSATNNSNKSYASWDGTSMASPHVCGAAALLLSAGMAAADVDDKILSNATQDKITDRKGSPNLLLYVGDDSNPPTPPTSPPPTPPTGKPYHNRTSNSNLNHNPVTIAD